MLIFLQYTSGCDWMHGCGSHLEEDCEYNGELLKKISPGNILDANSCQRTCEILAPNCKYWIFNRREFVCILKRDGRKRCTARGGPKEPSYDRCQNLTMSRHAL